MKTSILCLLVVVLFSGSAAAESIPVKWENTPSLFASYVTVVRTHSGGRLEGQWLSVKGDEGTMKIEKASAGAIGLRTIRRDQIASVQLIRRRVGGRVIGTVLGSLIGVSVGASFAVKTNSVGAGYPVGLLPAIGGHLIGRAFDRKPISVVILPD